MPNATRAWLRAAPGEMDCILLDAYANQFEIPLHLATEEFFAEAHAALRDGGVLAINLGQSYCQGARHGMHHRTFVDAVELGVVHLVGITQRSRRSAERH